MSRPSKKHHYVPQAQLCHFSSDQNQRQIFVFDKQTDRVFLSSIRNAGSENDFNTVSVGDRKWNFEDLFQDVDARSAQLIAKITSKRSLAWLTADDHIALTDLFATQLLRTHFARSTPRRLAEQMREMIRQTGYDPDQSPDMAMPTDAALRLGAVEAFLDRSGHAIELLPLRPALYTTEGKHRFIISDHPVSITNAFPYGYKGLAAQGVLVMLPISLDLTIVLHCPSIVMRYESAENTNLKAEQRAQILHCSATIKVRIQRQSR